MSDPSGFSVRPAVAGDEPEILELLCQTLGWENDDRHRQLFQWKHRDNSFGPSAGWVAEDEAGLVGSRTFMRWGFRQGDRRYRAVRAVDTATRPRAQGRGVFRALTMRGVEEMTAEGVDWVFNTPNDRSAPGYLSMGWRRIGRLPVAVRPAGIARFPRLMGARRPGELWSSPTSAGEDAAAVLDDASGVADLLGRAAPRPGLATERSPQYLAWRYGLGPMGYRVMLAGKSVADGLAFFRLRRRGPALEAVIADVLLPARANLQPSGRLMYRRILKAAAADYLIALGPHRPAGWLPVPRTGPLLTCRALANPDPPPAADWDLSAGDIELF